MTGFWGSWDTRSAVTMLNELSSNEPVRGDAVSAGHTLCRWRRKAEKASKDLPWPLETLLGMQLLNICVVGALPRSGEMSFPIGGEYGREALPLRA